MKTSFTWTGVIAILITTLFFTLSDALAKSFSTHHWQTNNGARVIFYRTTEVPMLDIKVAFAAGSAYDGEQLGLSALTTRLLNQGNGGLDANAIAEKLAATGAQYKAENTQDMVLLSLKTLTSHDALKQANAMFALIINHPDFLLNAFEREKKQQLMHITQTKESPEEVANQTFFQALYQNHPYAHPIEGDLNSVAALTISQVRHFYERFFVSSNAVIVLVGAIDKTTAQALAEQIVRDLPKGQAASAISIPQPLTEHVNLNFQFPSSQTMLRLGQLGITHHDENYFPLMVGNYILGGGTLVSRLGQEVREKRGLTYGVYSQFSSMLGNGPFVICLSTQNDQIKTALDVTRETLLSFVKTGPNEQELIAAKKYLTGSFPLSLANNCNIAEVLLKIAFYRLPEDYLDTYLDRINAVTTAEIKQAFQQQITPNRLLQITVGKT